LFSLILSEIEIFNFDEAIKYENVRFGCPFFDILFLYGIPNLFGDTSFGYTYFVWASPVELCWAHRFFGFHRANKEKMKIVKLHTPLPHSRNHPSQEGTL